MHNSPSGPARDARAGKMAIPKLDRGQPQGNEGTNKEDRVARACKICRRRKVRCSGDLPRCKNCETNGLDCQYEQARRDRLKEAMRLNQKFVALLKDLGERVDEDDKKKINDALEDAEDDLIGHTSARPVKSLGKRNRSQSPPEEEEEKEQHGEAFVTASVGSNEDLDFLGEDLMRSRESRETGYVGQNSEIQWLRSVQRQSEPGNTDPNGQRYGPPGSSRGAMNERSEALHERRQHSKPGSMGHITDASFYLDSENIEVDIAVDPYEIPEPRTAEQLFNCYMNTVHSSFPVIPMYFEGQFRRYLESVKLGRAFQVPEKWRATMNLIFAIGAKYSHLIGAEWRGDERDHLVYMTRAIHLLGLKNTVMVISGPNLELVQATGALAFYFLVIGHVSRAWIMIGLSVRLALSLGLHLRNEDPSLDDAKREPLVRTWWSLHSIECLVSSITGRPPVVAYEDCTVSLPKMPRDSSASRPSSRIRKDYGSPPTSTSSTCSDSDRRSATESHYLRTHIHVTLISQKVLLSLFSPRTAVQSWEYVQNKITELLNELETWAKDALSEDVSPRNLSSLPQFERERFLLKICYWSTKVLITRPCLCRIERRISNESDTSVDFNKKIAETCVEAARQLTNLFPEQPDTSFIYSQGPWWDVVHIIMQSTAVLLLEMAYEGKHMKDEKSGIIACIKKMIRWLRAMQERDPVAARAYHVIWKILKTCAPALQSQANELLSEDVKAPSQTQPHQGSPDFDQQAFGQWQEHDFAESLAGHPSTFDPQTFEQQTLFQNYGYEYAPYPYFVPEQPQVPMPFGNPFVTSFDQGAPVLSMQDLWVNPAPSANLGMEFSDMAISQHQRMQQQQIQQQMQQAEEMEQMEQIPNMGYSPSQMREVQSP